MGMNEARWRLRTNNTEQPVFSPQDIVECSEYSQGNGTPQQFIQENNLKALSKFINIYFILSYYSKNI